RLVEKQGEIACPIRKCEGSLSDSHFDRSSLAEGQESGQNLPGWDTRQNLPGWTDLGHSFSHHLWGVLLLGQEQDWSRSKERSFAPFGNV
ncbi:hypothetical protein PMAYCL1PPCAC_03164, partial [Pristionchus mayeri]